MLKNNLAIIYSVLLNFTIVLLINAQNIDETNVITNLHVKDTKFKENISRIELSTKIEFFNKKSFAGKIIFKSNIVKIKHRDGYTEYDMDLELDKIDYIHPITWFPEFHKVENDRFVYNFFPIEYIIKLKDGKYLNVVGRVKDFEILEFEYKYGRSKIYTYYIDYLTFDKTGNSRWKNMGTSDLNRNFRIPHPNVVYYVYFLD